MDDQQIPLFERVVDKNPPQMETNTALNQWIFLMGFSEVLKKLPALLRLQKVIIHYFSTSKPDVFIGVDAPDFNFLIERKLKRQGHTFDLNITILCL
jgi:lipid A disaccharide synthetase